MRTNDQRTKIGNEGALLLSQQHGIGTSLQHRTMFSDVQLLKMAKSSSEMVQMLKWVNLPYSQQFA